MTKALYAVETPYEPFFDMEKIVVHEYDGFWGVGPADAPLSLIEVQSGNEDALDEIAEMEGVLYLGEVE